jgi:LPS-assembly protein
MICLTLWRLVVNGLKSFVDSIERRSQNNSMFSMHFTVTFFLMLVTVCAFHMTAHAQVTVQTFVNSDLLIYNQDSNIVEASGNVVITQGSRTLEADKVSYNLDMDEAVASGNVILRDIDGSIHYADDFTLSNAMTEGFVSSLYTVLDDGSRLWAARAVRETPDKHVLEKARYTPCQACEINPDRKPAWALRASEVTHNQETASIQYEDVWFEAWGQPVAYIPYFSHPDGSIDQKSGFLAPVVGFGSDYGFNAMSSYYWAIAPDFDATIGARVFTKAQPQLNLELRKRYENAAVTAIGSATYSDRIDSVNGISIARDDEFRGHLELDSLWNINQYWRAGTDLKVTTDEQYLEQYDIEEDEDVLTNRIFAERFENRDYASVELLAFQDLRLDTDVDQPNALPYANMSFISKPDSALGGRLQWDNSFLSLFREGNDQDVNRVSSRIAWHRQDILPAGLTTKTELSLRGDAYYTSDRDIAKVDPTEDDAQFDTRLIPTANIEVAYPLQKQVIRGQIRVKPKLGLTARPDVDNDSDIPNEDSIDAQIDVTNLFEADRFPGLDRVEDRSRINYGVETGFYTDEGDRYTAEIGQSYRLDDEDNPFPNGSGFEEQASDIVGQIGASVNDARHNLNYRFQLNGQSLNAERHEIFGSTRVKNTQLSAIYFFEKGAENTEFTESREQVTAALTQQVGDSWTVRAGALYDLGEEPGLRRSSLGIAYDDECYGVSAEVQRELQREASGSNDTTVFLRFRLKNLGEFEATAYDYSSPVGGAL